MQNTAYQTGTAPVQNRANQSRQVGKIQFENTANKTGTETRSVQNRANQSGQARV